MPKKETGVNDTPQAGETTETKAEKFARLANIRAKQVLKGLLRLENLGKSYAYEFTEADIETLFSAIDKQINSTKQVFINRLEGKKGNEIEDIFKNPTEVSE